MANTKKIFVATDFSACAEYAVGYAAEFAKRFGAQVVVGHVVDTSYLTYAALYGQQVVVDPDLPSVEAAAQKHLGETAARFSEAGVQATTLFARGNPVTELSRMIDESRSVLAIIGTHGHTGFNRFLFGSTCEKLLRHSVAPVLAVKPPDEKAVFSPDDFSIKNVVCTTDLSDLSRSVFPFAAELCATMDASLTLLHVIDARFDALPYGHIETPTLEHLRGRAESLLKEWSQYLKAPRVHICVAHGVPHRSVEEYVRDHDTDLLIMATHGHGGVAHALLGSTTERVVRTAACPVMAIRPR